MIKRFTVLCLLTFDQIVKQYNLAKASKYCNFLKFDLNSK